MMDESRKMHPCIDLGSRHSSQGIYGLHSIYSVYVQYKKLVTHCDAKYECMYVCMYVPLHSVAGAATITIIMDYSCNIRATCSLFIIHCMYVCMYVQYIFAHHITSHPHDYKSRYSKHTYLFFLRHVRTANVRFLSSLMRYLNTFVNLNFFLFLQKINSNMVGQSA